MTMKRPYKKPIINQVVIAQSQYLLGNNSVTEWEKTEKNNWGGDEENE